MASLICCIGEGKGTWGHVARVIEGETWDKIFIVSDEFFKDKFTVESKKQVIEQVIINNKESVEAITQALLNALKDKVFGDVAVNLFSGSGKEHMAVLSALMKSGAGIRLMGFGDGGVKEL